MAHQLVRAGKSAAVLIAAAIAIAACGNSDKPGESTAVKADSLTLQAPVPAAVDSGKLIGAWHDEAIKSEKGEQIAYELVTNKDKFYLQAITFVGTNLKLNDTPPITPAASELTKDDNKYTSVERPNETYVVDKDGDLLIYDGTELIAKCKKLI